MCSASYWPGMSLFLSLRATCDRYLMAPAEKHDTSKSESRTVSPNVGRLPTRVEDTVKPARCPPITSVVERLPCTAVIRSRTKVSALWSQCFLPSSEIWHHSYLRKVEWSCRIGTNILEPYWHFLKQRMLWTLELQCTLHSRRSSTTISRTPEFPFPFIRVASLGIPRLL